MSYPSFSNIFYSKDPLPTITTLIIDEDDVGSKYPKINWNTCVVDLEERNNSKEKQQNLMPYLDNEEGLIDCLDFEDHYEILPTKSGKFLTTFHVPSSLIPAIVGPKGSKLKHLQDMTQTLIKVPRINEVGMPIKITGSSERSVASARNQITLVVLSRREKFPNTHFVSIPVGSSIIKSSFEKFKKEILSDSNTRGIDESIFQNPDKLHMTIEVLTLLDELEIEDAKQLLTMNITKLVRAYLPEKQYEFRLKGIEIMNDDPTEVDVLYAKVQIDNQNDHQDFQELVNQISNIFYLNGYVRKQYDQVKLHVTLMNSLFRRTKGENAERTTFDASFIMKKFVNFDFGTTVFRNIDLSIRYSTGANGYYDSVVSIPIST